MVHHWGASFAYSIQPSKPISLGVNTPEQDAISPALPPLPNSMGASRPQSSVPWNLLFAAVGCALALKLFGPAWVRTFVHPTSSGAVMHLGILLAALAAAIVLHEAGHLAAALLLDFDVLGGSLGPVRAIRLHGRWTLQFSRSLFSGSVIAIPLRNDATWRPRMLAVVAAGPIATLITGVAAAVFLEWPSFAESWVTPFLSGLAELSFFIFVLGLFPNASASRTRNDARLFFSLLHNTAEAREILLYHVLTQLQIAGVRPRDYPNQIIRQLAQARGRAEMCLAYANAIAEWALDRGDAVSADAWNKRALDLSEFCDLKQQSSALAAAAFFEITLRHDLRAAANQLADLEFDLLSPRWFRHRTRAVYWLATGNIHESLAEIARAQYAFPNRFPYYDFQKVLLGRLHRIAIETPPQELKPLQRVALIDK
jgi:hypothetical protein